MSCVFGACLCLCGSGICSSAQFLTKNDCMCSCGCLASLSSLNCSCNCSMGMRWYSCVCLGYSEAELRTGYFSCCCPWQSIIFSLDLIIFLWWFRFVFRGFLKYFYECKQILWVKHSELTFALEGKVWFIAPHSQILLLSYKVDLVISGTQN